MNKIRTIIIEDEELFADNFEQILSETEPDIEIVAKIESIASAIAWLSENHADLIFLDIHLSDGLSFEIFEKVKIDVPVIFLTSYDHYAIKAFKLNSIDYLLKPLNIEDLKIAMAKYRKLSAQPTSIPDFSQLLNVIKGSGTNFKKRFVIYVGDKIKYINIEDLAYFFICSGEVFMRDFEGSTYPAELSLDKLQPVLDPSVFFRVSRQCIINLKAIKNIYSISKNAIKIELTPKPDEDVYLSVSRIAAFKKWLNQ